MALATSRRLVELESGLDSDLLMAGVRSPSYARSGMLEAPTARQTPALEALGRALAWALTEGKQVPGIITTEDMERLTQALRGGPFAPELYPKLRLFVQIVWRIELPPGVPTCTLGDALEGIAELDAVLPAWPFEPAVEPVTFRALEYAENAAGLDRAYRAHKAGWDAHGERSRRFIRGAVSAVEGRDVVWVLGAGRAYDLPLRELAERFQRVVLVDIDRRALEETVASAEPSLRARLEPVAADVTGIASTWRARTLAAVREATDARDAAERLYALARGYVVAEEDPWRFLGARPDLIVSQMLLSQLNDPLERYQRRVYEERFGASPFDRHPGLRVANMLFAHRLQHDHVTFLRRHAAAAVLTSDVAEQLAAPGGGPEPAGDELLLLGTYRLAERIPRGLEIAQRDQWLWARAAGSRMRVGALLLRARP
jgi:hypothetical protein